MNERLQGSAPGAERRPVFLARTAFGLACLLLASAAVCWVAANWQQASNLQKLLGAQSVLAALVAAALWAVGRRPTAAGVGATWGRGNINFAASAHLAGLAGVATGVLLALVGQIYQTGADAWQLFATWALLLIPWLLTQHTMFLGLLFAAVLNTALALYLQVHDARIWWGFGTSWAGSALMVALLNAVLLAAWERGIAYFDDAWRVGPRVLSAAMAGWLVAAAFAGIDSHGGPIGVSIVGWAALACMYMVYTRLRPDLAIVSLAALAAFILLVLPLLHWVGSEAGLLLVVIVLLAAMAVGLRKLGQLLRARAVAADTWYVSAFRLVAMGITAVLLIVFLLITLEFEVGFLWAPGLMLCVVGLAAYRWGDTDVLRELGLTLATAGLLLGGGSFFALHEEGVAVAVYALAALGVVAYALAANAAFRFIAAFFALGMVTIMSWPSGAWEAALFDGGGTLHNAPLPVYLRVWWFGLAGAWVLLQGRGEQAGRRWRPLGWALVFLAQITVWQAPAPSPASIAGMWRDDPSVVVIWLACAALPVAALAAVLWRKPSMSMPLRIGAPLAFAVAAVGWMGAPGVSLALLWLIIGFAMAHRSLMGFGVLALLAYLMRFYYQLDSTLLYKSFVLGATGAWLLASAWALKRLTPGAARADLAAGSTHAASSSARSLSLPWKRGGLIVGLLLVLAVANSGIYQREAILSDGRRVVLELAPVDPRSLMQGDYMRLDFDVAREVQNALRQAPETVRRKVERRGAGLLVLRPDAQGVHRLAGLLPLPAPGQARTVADAGSASLQNEVLLEFRLRDGQVRVVTDAWFFSEGRASHFEQSRYGEFRVDHGGNGLLVDMLDDQQRSLSQR